MAKLPIAFCVLVATIIGMAAGAHAAEIKVLVPMGMKSSFSELIPQFVHSSGHKVSIDYGTLAAMTDRIKKGEVADSVIVTTDQIVELEKAGRIIAGSRVGFAKVGVGAMVHKGAPKPDISSEDAFKRALLAAKSITYVDPAKGGVSGIHIAKIIERLGISAEMKPKTLLRPPGDQPGTIARGEAELGFDQFSVIVGNPNVDAVGLLPEALQFYTEYSGGIVVGSKQEDATKALLAFISSPPALALMIKKGYQPL